MTPHRIPGLRGIPDLGVAVSPVAFGNMAYTWGPKDEVRRNRKSFFDAARIPMDRSVAMQIEHGTDIAEVTSSFCGRGIFGQDDYVRGDALATREKGVFLFLLTGDCLPLVLFDPVQQVCILAHVSRMNAARHFPKLLVRYPAERFGSDPADMIAAIGPAIHKESYIFDEASAREKFPFPSPFISPAGGGKVSIDLVGWSVEELMGEGIRAGNIFVDPVDTGSDRNFFSHARSSRAGEPEGRFATVVGMAGKQ